MASIISLSTLAVELIELIATNLEPADLCSLRLTDKSLHDKTFHSFSQKCFHTLRTNLSDESIERLKECAKQEQLRLCVRTLTITSVDSKGTAKEWAHFRNRLRRAPSMWPALEVLCNILQYRLVNCRSFQLSAETQRLAGADRIRITSGSREAEAVAVGFFTLMKIAEWHVESIYTDFRFRAQTPKQVLAVEAKWSQVQELVLDYCLVGSDTGALRIIGVAQNLRRLMLGDPDGRESEFGSAFWFTTKLRDSDRPKDVYMLPALEELNLLNGWVTKEHLSSFVRNCSPSLRNLTLQRMYLFGGGTYESFFSGLAEKLINLESFHIAWLGIPATSSYQYIALEAPGNDWAVPETDGQTMKRIFSPSDSTDPDRICGASYRGPRMDLALVLLSRAVAPRPHFRMISAEHDFLPGGRAKLKRSF